MEKTYKSVKFTLTPNKAEFSEILSAQLDAVGFEGIFEEEQSVTAYIKANQFEESGLKVIKKLLGSLHCTISWETKEIIEQNWNRVWEENFEPVIIPDQCVVRAPFHQEFSEYDLVITIEPKMSFGTGHHQTTRLMMEEMLRMDLSGKKVLDMGCGTGVLAILAEKLGAVEVLAVDNDQWSYENTLENISRNSCKNIEVIKGSVNKLPEQEFNLILANINRNILLEQIPSYAIHAAAGSYLLLSGILLQDEETIRERAEEAGYRHLRSAMLENWMLLIFQTN